MSFSMNDSTVPAAFSHLKVGAQAVLLVMAVQAMTACTGDDDYQAAANILTTKRTGYIDKGGIKGKVMAADYIVGATVCFDSNKNGLCDSAEEQEETYAGGAFSFSEEISSGNENALLIAVVDTDNGRYLLAANSSADSQEQVISPFTTLVVNEQFFNPYVNAEQALAIQYLEEALALSTSLLAGEDYLASAVTDTEVRVEDKANSLVHSFQSAYALKTSDPYVTLANVVDALIKNNSLSVVIDDIKVQNRLDTHFKLQSLNLTKQLEERHEDQLSLGSAYANGTIITHSKWHNHLNILDASEKNSAPTLLDQGFYLYVEGERDAVDAVSGATEQVLSKLEVNSNADTLYAMVKKYGDDSDSGGLGIYVSDIGSGQVPDTVFLSESPGSYFFENDALTDIFLSSDDTKLVTSDDNRNIRVFNSADMSQPVIEIQTTDKVRSIAMSDDNTMVFAGMYKKRASYLAIYDVATQALLATFDMGGTPKNILIKNRNEIFVSLNDDNIIYHLDISDSANIQSLASFSSSSNILKLSLSSARNTIMATLKSKQVNVFDLDNPANVASLTLDDYVTSAFEIDSNKMAVTYGSSIDYFSLQYDAIPLTDSEKAAWREQHRE